MDFGKRFKHSRGKLLCAFASSMDAEQTAKVLGFFIDRIIEPMAEG